MSDSSNSNSGDRFKPGDRVRHVGTGYVAVVERVDDKFLIVTVGDSWEMWHLDNVVRLPAPEPAQVGGDHYTRLAVQPWDVMIANAPPVGVWWTCKYKIEKYIARAPWKNEQQDIDKLVDMALRLQAYIREHPEAWAQIREASKS